MSAREPMKGSTEMNFYLLEPEYRYHAERACIVEHEVRATVTGRFAGIPGNGREVRFRMLHVFEFTDGRISRENVWMDAATVMAQLAEPVAI